MNRFTGRIDCFAAGKAAKIGFFGHAQHRAPGPSVAATRFSPSLVLANEAPWGKAFRIGGMVEAGSLKRQGDGLTVRFNVTDTAKAVPVVYTGILPDLFKEGKGVVAQGQLTADGVFQATQILAKHDENYMPPEAAHAMEQAKKAQKILSQ
jgi:cytochrome c-type biogenesis protein CcmE